MEWINVPLSKFNPPDAKQSVERMLRMYSRMLGFEIEADNLAPNQLFVGRRQRNCPPLARLATADATVESSEQTPWLSLASSEISPFH